MNPSIYEYIYDLFNWIIILLKPAYNAFVERKIKIFIWFPNIVDSLFILFIKVREFN